MMKNEEMTSFMDVMATSCRAPSGTLASMSVKDPAGPSKSFQVTFSLHPKVVGRAGFMKGDRLGFQYSKDTIKLFQHPAGPTLGLGNPKSETSRFRIYFRLVPSVHSTFKGKSIHNVEAGTGEIILKYR